jgi:hypothetical protein
MRLRLRIVVLVGSAPRGGVGMATLTPEFQAMVVKKYEAKDGFLDAQFRPPTTDICGPVWLERKEEMAATVGGWHRASLRSERALS